EQLPDLEVSVHGEMLAPAQLSALATGEIDLALLRPPVGSADLVVDIVRQDRLFVAVPEGAPIGCADGVRAKDLRDAEFIAHVGHGRSVMNGVLATICAGAGFVPHIRHEVAETSTLVTLVAAGLGVALVPEPTAALGIAGVRYLPLKPEAPTVDLAVARLADEPSPAIEHALAVLHRVATSA
ncbi:MAG: LysR family substrate-binding domain-containing protein, partial [Actinomycetota bacterium]|nr:LysR family substrate-binding domain-containing protein [Actinomycetota bacterium]